MHLNGGLQPCRWAFGTLRSERASKQQAQPPGFREERLDPARPIMGIPKNDRPAASGTLDDGVEALTSDRRPDGVAESALLTLLKRVV